MVLGRMTFEVLTDREMAAIFEAAQRIVTQVHLTADGTDEFFDKMAATGCVVDGPRIGFPRSVLDVAIEQAAKRKPAGPCSEPAPVEWIQPLVSGQGIHYADVETDKLRPATRQDLALLSWIVDALPEYVGRSHPTFIPQDVPLANADLHAYATIILNASRPHPVSVYSLRTLRYFTEISDIVYGSRARTKAEAPFKAKMWITTPFKICRTDIEVALTAQKLLDRPVVFGCMPVIGLSTPVTLAGGLAQAVAEGLMIDILGLALNGEIVADLPYPLIADLHSASICESGPDNILAKLATSQLRHYIYGDPPVTPIQLSTTAKTPGAQAILEKLGNGLVGVLTGARSYSAVGTLGDTDIGSFVQLMIDLEITSYLQRLVDGIQVTPETIAQEVIKDVVPTGARYMEHPHTLDHFREELWLPQLMDRRLTGAWMEDPRTMVDNARAKARSLMQSAENQSPLNADQRQEIERILRAADREVAY
jgi:trimethylamine--corrinoid protein Co-methyltransferase